MQTLEKKPPEEIKHTLFFLCRIIVGTHLWFCADTYVDKYIDTNTCKPILYIYIYIFFFII